MFPQFFHLSSSFVPQQQDAEEAFSSICSFLRDKSGPLGTNFGSLFRGTFSTK